MIHRHDCICDLTIVSTGGKCPPHLPSWSNWYVHGCVCFSFCCLLWSPLYFSPAAESHPSCWLCFRLCFHLWLRTSWSDFDSHLFSFLLPAHDEDPDRGIVNPEVVAECSHKSAFSVLDSRLECGLKMLLELHCCRLRSFLSCRLLIVQVETEPSVVQLDWLFFFLTLQAAPTRMSLVSRSSPHACSELCAFQGANRCVDTHLQAAGPAGLTLTMNSDLETMRSSATSSADTLERSAETRWTSRPGRCQGWHRTKLEMRSTGCTVSVIWLQERFESTGGSNASPRVSEMTWASASSAGTATRPTVAVAITAFASAATPPTAQRVTLSPDLFLQIQTCFLQPSFHMTVIAPYSLLDRVVQQWR